MVIRAFSAAGLVFRPADLALLAADFVFGHAELNDSWRDFLLLLSGRSTCPCRDHSAFRVLDYDIYEVSRMGFVNYFLATGKCDRNGEAALPAP
jgi:hypothetical protein